MATSHTLGRAGGSTPARCQTTARTHESANAPPHDDGTDGTGDSVVGVLAAGSVGFSASDDSDDDDDDVSVYSYNGGGIAPSFSPEQVRNNHEWLLSIIKNDSAEDFVDIGPQVLQRISLPVSAQVRLFERVATPNGRPDRAVFLENQVVGSSGTATILLTKNSGDNPALPILFTGRCHFCNLRPLGPGDKALPGTVVAEYPGERPSQAFHVHDYGQDLSNPAAPSATLLAPVLRRLRAQTGNRLIGSRNQCPLISTLSGLLMLDHASLLALLDGPRRPPPDDAPDPATRMRNRLIEAFGLNVDSSEAHAHRRSTLVCDSPPPPAPGTPVLMRHAR